MSDPVYLSRISAGFPSPASDYVESDIDLNEWLVRNRLATYIVRVEGYSMKGEIRHDDRLIVDRSLEPRHGDVVVACVDGRARHSSAATSTGVLTPEICAFQFTSEKGCLFSHSTKRVRAAAPGPGVINLRPAPGPRSG